MTTVQNYINHIVFVLDASLSMKRHEANVITVADAQIAHLAQRSQELDQETRVTIYTFGGRDKFECIVYDKDVLRLPSLKGRYAAIHGHTALIDATGQALRDLNKTPELYGDHAFLTYVLTDGQDNNSATRPAVFAAAIQGMPENWTIACLVPDANAVFEAKKFGFAPNNIAVWDTRSERGMVEVGQTIRQSTDVFMTNRAAGVRGTKTLFQAEVDKGALQQAVQRGAVEPMHFGQYRLLPVKEASPIAEFVEANLKRKYVTGEAYYQLTKTETIQAQKKVAIRDNKTSQLFSGPAARQILNLPPYEVRVGPDFSPAHTIFVQSTSTNRKLVPGTQLLII